MGEIDTKPIESVQTAINLFGQSNDHRKNSPSNDKEMEIEILERELASVRVQLEAKEALHNQALVKIDHYHKTAEELSTLLKNSDAKKNFYINRSEEAISRAAELESALETTARQLTELKEELSGAITRLEMECAAKEAQRLESEHQIAEKSAHIDSLQLEIERAGEALKEELEKTRWDQAALEAEVRRITGEAADAKAELERAREQENEAQVEIALLKFQLHKGRSRLAAAEAAEARAQSEKTALYNALQQMGLEAEETKKENRMLKEAATSADPQQNDEADAEAEEEELMMRSKKELEDTKRELEVAVSKIGELRARVEQATSRAEAAEKGRAALEEQNKKRMEHKERRKAALAALRIESMSREFVIKQDIGDDDYDSAKVYQPLGKVLNMKF